MRTLGFPVSPAATGPPVGIALSGAASSDNSATIPNRGARARLRRGGAGGLFDVRWKSRKTREGYRVRRNRAGSLCGGREPLLLAAVRRVSGVDHARVRRGAAARLVVRGDVVPRLQRVVPVVAGELVVPCPPRTKSFPSSPKSSS